VLVDELHALGLGDAHEARGGARATGSLTDALRVCLWSRVANRVLFALDHFPAPDPDALYRGVLTIDWSRHIDPDGTLAVHVVSSRSEVSHERFAAQRVKDAVVDQMRERFGHRPDVDKATPDVRIHVVLRADEATVAIDLAGEGLNRRGYRAATAPAPLKENVAAGILLRAGWPAQAALGRPLVDPMAGTGTFAIEAALVAADFAPGLARERWGFSRWMGHDPEAWSALVLEARARIRPAPAGGPVIVGFDADAEAVAAADRNARAAGVDAWVRFERRSLDDLAAPATSLPAGPGLVITNPPYGVRLGDPRTAQGLFARLGDLLRARFGGWDAWVLAGDDDLGRCLGLRADRRNTLFNGPLECRLLHVPVHTPSGGVMHPEASRAALEAAPEVKRAFANRLRKNVTALSRWAVDHDIHALRVYDADIPEYAVAVDRYEDHVVVQEYAPPADVDLHKAALRLDAVLGAVPEVLGLPAGHVHLKVRRRQRGSAQYERLGETGQFHVVREGGLRFLCNFDDHLDTGLFLDHRPTRDMLRRLAKGRRVLNLFAYTGTASVYAADGGARRVVTVDLSNTYLGWARRNFELNRQRDDVHELVRADCVTWSPPATERFDLIFLDPPTFSTGKSMDGTWDVQRDHAALVARVASLLAPGGILVLSTNAQRFRLEVAAPPGLSWHDLSAATIPRDFARSPRIHRAFALMPEGEPPPL
jgi:23S rRNA (guanine2445-N2)-methyltransferase / 23S rRNA (guanine2069-N7)-methyltransferase